MRADVLERDGEGDVAGGRVLCAATAAFVKAVAVQLAEVAEVAAADAREDMVAGVPHGCVVAARLQGALVQGALTVHDQAVLLRGEVPHRAEHLVEHPVRRVGHRHQPGWRKKRISASARSTNVFSFSGVQKKQKTGAFMQETRRAKVNGESGPMKKKNWALAQL